MGKDKIFLFAVCAYLLLISGCSSSKHSGKLSYAGRVYHNTTAHYNGYYYGKLKITDEEKSMISGNKDDYSKLLPIYLAGNPQASAAGADMDSAIKKLTLDLHLHPKSKWVPDCYFYIGKAYYYKKNYDAALGAFQYVSSAKNAGNSKKKHGTTGATASATDNAPKQSLLDDLKHRPVRNEDMLWIVRSLSDLKKYGDAEAVLSYLGEDKQFPSNLQDDLLLVTAYMNISNGRYDAAVDPLKKATALTKNKKDKTRYTYILGQLYQMNGNNAEAAKAFEEVSKLKPDYQMDFNARINVANSFVASGGASASGIIAELTKMAHDEKYTEFYDQIYYAIAQIYLKQGAEDDAVKSLETSIDKSVSNNNQKGLSYLQLGELNFNEKDYMTAAPDYDSAVTYLDSKYEGLDAVKSRHAILDNLAKQVTIILYQDSLQKIAAMSEKDRDKFIDNLLTKYEEKQERDSLQSANVLGQQAQNNSSQNSGSSSSWYFYNTTLKASGYNDFKKVWGSRTNDDNWRRGGKGTAAGSEDQNVSASDSTLNEEDEGAPVAVKGTVTRESLLANVPLGKDRMAVSNHRILTAYNRLGLIYKDDLTDLPNAIDTYEKLVARFPNDNELGSAYYNLYLLYQQTNNSAKAETYRQLILKNYPSSMYAGMITDPDYLKKQEDKKNEIDHFYASTYTFYQQENYSEVIARVHASDSLFKSNPLKPKFALLNAFAVGKTQDRTAYIAALDSVVKKFPKGEEHDKAVEILNALGAPVNDVKKIEGSGKNTGNSSPYVLHPNDPQYVIVYLSSDSEPAKPIMDSISDFNTTTHSLDNLKITTQILDVKTRSQLILVKQFKNSQQAVDYFTQLSNTDIFDDLDDYQIFIIDDKNYPLYFQRKDSDAYMDFFNSNYLK